MVLSAVLFGGISFNIKWKYQRGRVAIFTFSQINKLQYLVFENSSCSSKIMLQLNGANNSAVSDFKRGERFVYKPSNKFRDSVLVR